ncbi:diguanylate cyclase domain-containing protein [Clostridium weizhouense]|uniref:GGDEF domain-containing protein n=1 Tax=Clostridium weizhouense TaxID=2859781 RepID=A0ABS7ARY0_9CLOT|nr:diguanylate cyclase [Clostridium weizhouense]MBW6411304.1 GGDEF domain-containing protein [Clostridium weizhouense]
MNKLIKIDHKNLIVKLLVFSVVLFLISIIISGIFMNYNSNTFIGKNAINLNNDWLFINKRTEEQDIIKFPLNLKYSKDTIYSFSKTIKDDNFSNDKLLCLRTGFANLDVYINDNLIYNFSDDSYDKFSNRGKSTLHMIKLPSELYNKNLTFKVEMGENPYLPYDIKTPLIGTKSEIIYNLISSQILNYIILFLMINFTIIIFNILGIALLKKVNNLFHLLSIGLFALLATTYSISETNILQLLLPNTYLLNNLTFMSLMLVSIPIIMIMLETTNKKYTQILVPIIYLDLTNFIVQVVLNFLGVFDFRSMLFISHILIITNSILCLYIIINSRKNRNIGSKYFEISIIPMLIGTLIDITLFYLYISTYYGICFQIGVLFFIMIQLGYVINSHFNYYRSSIQSTIYERMAFTDIMTSLENRAAFEEKIVHVNRNLNSYDSIWCLSMDINNLKEINDTLGHSSGDKLINSFANILNKNFSEIAHCYRIGGDEFIAILLNVSEKNLKNKLNTLHSMIKAHNLNSPLKLSAAIGYDNFKFDQDINLNDLISRSDKLMYENKRNMKNLIALNEEQLNSI